MLGGGGVGVGVGVGGSGGVKLPAELSYINNFSNLKENTCLTTSHLSPHTFDCLNFIFVTCKKCCDGDIETLCKTLIANFYS